MEFRASQYGTGVERILAMGGNGARIMPLAPKSAGSEDARAELHRWKAGQLFPDGRCPEGAMSGLYLYFSCLDEAHTIAQDIESPEGSFWHGILHRQEPDAGNAAYWFRQVGKHPVFPALRVEAERNRFYTGPEWDPFAFIDFCESARQRPGSEEEMIAMRVQLKEWQLLFDYCASAEHRETAA